ncbi:MAG: hypothetical protein P8R48_01960 [Planctomycetota bacterium]|nr:hypothetical protein [Planctomycetota bacterium]
MPYISIATNLDNVPHDKLLQEKGFRGFPTLAFMDAAGNVIGQPYDRTLAAFSSSRDALMAIGEVRRKSDAGDMNAAVELLFLEYTLGTIDAEALQIGVGELADHASREQLARAKQIGLDGDIYDLYLISLEDDESYATVKMLAMLDAGQMPTPGSRACIGFWSALGEHAREKGDAELLRRVVRGMRADMASDNSSMQQADGYEEIAVGIDKRDALVARQDAGEKKLEAQILLIEANIDAVNFTAFRGRLAAAMAVATDEEKTELQQAGVDLEVKEIMDSYESGGDRDETHLRLMALLVTNDPAPSGDLLGMLGLPIYYYSRSVTDPAVLDKHAATLTARYGADSQAAKLAEILKDAAEKLRSTK